MSADWQHLKAYGYAPGGYMVRCHSCEWTMIDLDKRAITCRECAEKMHAARGMEARSGETEGLDPKGDSPVPTGTRPETTSPQPVAPEGEALRLANELKAFIASEFGITGGSMHSRINRLVALAAPPQSPQAAEPVDASHIAFGAWAKREGHDVAYTYDTERSLHVWLNPMTADLWKAWQACLAIPAEPVATAEAENEMLRSAIKKIAAVNGEWGPFPETNEVWASMAIVTAREAIAALRGEAGRS